MAFYPGIMEIAPFELIAFISPRGHFAQLLPIAEGDSTLATFSIAQDLEKRIIPTLLPLLFQTNRPQII